MHPIALNRTAETMPARARRRRRRRRRSLRRAASEARERLDLSDESNEYPAKYPDLRRTWLERLGKLDSVAARAHGARASSAAASA